MDETQIQELLSLGTIDEAIADQLRMAGEAQLKADETRGRDYTTQIGRNVVANPGQAIADMFIRGNAAKERKAAEGEVAKQRTRRDEITKNYMDAVTGNVVDKRPMTVSTPRIGTPPPVDIAAEQAVLAKKFVQPATKPAMPPAVAPPTGAVAPPMPAAPGAPRMPGRPGQQPMDDAAVSDIIAQLTRGM